VYSLLFLKSVPNNNNNNVHWKGSEGTITNGTEPGNSCQAVQFTGLGSAILHVPLLPDSGSYKLLLKLKAAPIGNTVGNVLVGR
jgi:hypothetical protein